MQGRKLSLKVDEWSTRFTISRVGFTLYLRWQKDTEVENIIWARLVIIGICWPPIVHKVTFIEIIERGDI